MCNPGERLVFIWIFVEQLMFWQNKLTLYCSWSGGLRQWAFKMSACRGRENGKTGQGGRQAWSCNGRMRSGKVVGDLRGQQCVRDWGLLWGYGPSLKSSGFCITGLITSASLYQEMSPSGSLVARLFLMGLLWNTSWWNPDNICVSLNGRKSILHVGKLLKYKSFESNLKNKNKQPGNLKLVK